MTTTGPHEDLLAALTTLRERLGQCRFPLEVAGARDGRRETGELVGQLDDYILPRLRRLDAPLLAVVGGSTGAGKSTLVNSLAGTTISQAGVLRPTTRSPVLVCNVADQRWFVDSRVLPGLSRTTGSTGDPGSLQLVTTDALPAGLALLDAPDIDSVVTSNREMASQLLAAADLWLFITTAARYADAVPWDLLQTALERSTALAVVLDRVPPEAADEVTAHFAQMLSERGFGSSPLFVVPETPPVDGLLPESSVAPVRHWLHRLAGDADSRADVVRRTLDGALDSLRPRVERVATTAAEQSSAAGELREEAEAAYAAAADSVDEAMNDGSLLRGEVLARWQEFVGTGELLRSLEAQVGRLRDRVAAAVRGRPQPGDDLKVALQTGVEALVQAEADRAAETSAHRWRQHVAGAALLDDARGDLSRSSPDLPERAARAVRDWQGSVLELVRRQAEGKRTAARFLSLGVNGVGLVLMVGIFAHTGGLTGAEVGVAGGTSLVSQKLLEAVFGDQAVRDLAATARKELRDTVDTVLEDEVTRYLALLGTTGVDPHAATRLREAARLVERTR